MTARSHPRPPVDPAALNGGGGTMWTNLGYWARLSDGASDAPPRYPLAAAALARRVGLAAQLEPGDVVVDYACGFGDSLRLWVEEFGARAVVGIEPDPSVCRQVEARARDWGLSERIRVICAAAEDIAPTDAAADVTAVVCVDAAYHFRSRQSWLASVGASTPPGLRLGLADLSVADGRERSLRLRALARFMHIPRENLMSARSIAIACEDAGFSVTQCKPVGADVLDGFVTNIAAVSMPISVTRSAISFARRARLLDYCVIGARR